MQVMRTVISYHGPSEKVSNESRLLALSWWMKSSVLPEDKKLKDRPPSIIFPPQRYLTLSSLDADLGFFLHWFQSL